MESLVADTLASARLAVALAHCLPECSLEVTSDCGERLLVGFGYDAGITPCEACEAVRVAMKTSPAELGPLLGLPSGCPTVRLLDDSIDDSHIGLGVYRYQDDTFWGYVFATVLDSDLLRLIVKDESAERLMIGTLSLRRLIATGEWRLGYDHGLAVTICSSRYPAGAAELLPAAEELALDIARRSIVSELTG